MYLNDLESGRNVKEVFYSSWWSYIPIELVLILIGLLVFCALKYIKAKNKKC